MYNMGLLNTVSEIVEEFRATGKTEIEISDIIKMAADKSTVNSKEVREEHERRKRTDGH